MALRYSEENTVGWEVELRGEKSDLSFLVARCTLPELTVIVRNGTYILTSSLISSIADLDTVRSRLTTLLAMLNGLMRLCRIESLPVRVGPLTRLRKGGTTDQIIWAGIAADWLTISASPEQDRQFLGEGVSPCSQQSRHRISPYCSS